ncbi:MAG TPA: hypothetical protein VHE35_06475, partial [Kofleriaceae bacterium]|nr:hypothetical protein [Kofleriaceae bacterium]
VTIALVAGGAGGGGGGGAGGGGAGTGTGANAGTAIDAAAVATVDVDAGAVAAAPVDAAVHAAVAHPPRPAIDAGASVAVAAGTYDELHEQAKNAAFAGDFAKALALGQQALKLQPDSQIELFNCAVYAFSLGNCPLAVHYLESVHTDKADKLRAKCAQYEGGGHTKD